MRHLTSGTIPLVIFAALCLAAYSCRTAKDVRHDSLANTDSVATTVSHRALATLDSAFSRLNFDFDTLDVMVGRLVGDTTETFRLRAVKGQVASDRSQFRQAVEAKTRLDSTAYKVSSAATSAEHSATTVAYEPPKTSAVLILIVVAASVIILLRTRK